MGEMRDRRKTAAYFEAYIACEKRRLEKKLDIFLFTQNF